MRRLRNQLGYAAVGKRDCYLQIVFKRLSPRLGMRRQSGQSLTACVD
jgi:hypothetical protein